MLLRWHVHVGLDIQERTQFHDCTVGVAGNVYYDRDYNNAEQKVDTFLLLLLLVFVFLLLHLPLAFL